jgi:hypothetical protein
MQCEILILEQFNSRSWKGLGWVGANKISNGSISRFMYPQQEASVVCVRVRPDLLKILVSETMDHGWMPFRSCEPSSCSCMGKTSGILYKLTNQSCSDVAIHWAIEETVFFFWNQFPFWLLVQIVYQFTVCIQPAVSQLGLDEYGD